MTPTSHGYGPDYEDQDYDRRRERGRESSGWERDSSRRERDDRGRRSFQGRDDDERRDEDWRRRDSPDRRGRDDREPGGDEERDSHSHYRGFYARSIGRGPGGRGIRVSDTYLIVGPFTGRGPKGYQRSDERVTEEVSERLERHGDVDASEIEVSCSEGVVTLEGKVSDRRSKRLAEDCADDVYGVKDVMNQIRVDEGFFAKLLGRRDDDEDRERSRPRSDA